MLKHAVQYSTKRPFSVRFLMHFQACLSIHTYLKKSRKTPQKYLKGEGSIKSNFLLCNYGFFQYNELSPSKIDLLFIK